MKQIKFLLLFLFLWAPLLSSGQNIIAVTEDLAPLQYPTQTGAQGEAVDRFNAWAQAADIEVSTQIQPWPRAYQTALNRPNTLIYSMMRVEPRESLFEWIAPIAEINVWLYSYDPYVVSLGMDERHLAQFSGALIIDGAADHYYRDSSLRFSPMADDVAMAKMLAAGRLDYVIHTDLRFDALLRGHNTDNKEIYKLAIPDLSRVLWLAANVQTDPDIINALRAAAANNPE